MFAFVRNAAGAPLSAGVLYRRFGLLLRPTVAVAAMLLNSASVIAGALRLRGRASDGACCGTGHGCCVAYLHGGENRPPPHTGNRLVIVLEGAPPGLGAAKLPEPPRPIR